MSRPKPVLQALVLADQIYEDKLTGKKVIAGTFNCIWSASFPATLDRMTWAFIALTEVRSPIDLEIQFRRMATQDVLLTSPKIPLSPESPLSTYELVMPVDRLPLPTPGIYSLDVLFEEEILGSLRITATIKSQEDKK
jgi:hypothetical protein